LLKSVNNQADRDYGTNICIHVLVPIYFALKRCYKKSRRSIEGAARISRFLYIWVLSIYIMVPLSERRHRLYENEIPEVVEGLKLRLSHLLENREEGINAEIAFRVFYRLTRDEPGRPKYPRFSWEQVQYYIDFYDVREENEGRDIAR